MIRHILNLSLRLMLVCLIAAIGLGLTYSAVKDRIAEMEKEEREKAGEEVLAPLGAQPEEDLELLSSLQAGFPDLVGVFRGVDEGGELAGYALVVKAKGYSFIIMAVGVDLECRITGVEVVQQEETPGLGGSLVESSEFMGQFLDGGPDDLVLGVDIDAKTGATMTSKGLTDGVNMALDICRYLRETGGQ